MYTFLAEECTGKKLKPRLKSAPWPLRAYPPCCAPMGARGSAAPRGPFPLALSPTNTPSSALLQTIDSRLYIALLQAGLASRTACVRNEQSRCRRYERGGFSGKRRNLVTPLQVFALKGKCLYQVLATI